MALVDAQTGKAGMSKTSQPHRAVRTGFDQVLETLRRHGLHMPVETVANYLLALQTKRFVVLSGISGTGKSQLALAVADAFCVQSATPREASAMGATNTKTVTRAMLKKPTLTLPVALLDHINLPVPANRPLMGTVRAIFPGGALDLKYSRQTPRSVVVLFKGELSKWFRSTWREGDELPYVVERLGAGVPGQLRFGFPNETAVPESGNNVCPVAVRPDWTDNRGLLGYFNPILKEYVATPLLRFMLDAAAESSRAASEDREPEPFFVVLDEMNLARVEHYFSDFLSCLESGDPLHLHDGDQLASGETGTGMPVPQRLGIPENLFFTGTVNVDETTYMFSPKVLDRSFVIEFNHVDLGGYGGEGAHAGAAQASDSLYLSAFPGTLRPARRPDKSDWRRFGELGGGRWQTTLVALHALLEAEHRHFGYRVANEIARFVVLAVEQAGESEDTVRAAFDLAVLQKVLPKFHGTQRELQEVLSAIFRFALSGTVPGLRGGGEAWADWQSVGGTLRPRGRATGSAEARGGQTGEVAPEPESPMELPRTAHKTWRMLWRLQGGFTSFME